MGVAPGVDTQAESRHGVSHVPSEGSLCARVPTTTVRRRTVAAVAVDMGHEQGAATEETWAVGNGLYLQVQIAGSKVSLLVDTGSGYRSSLLGSGESGIDRGTSWPGTGDNCARSRDGRSSIYNRQDWQ